jgi:hypothetical protein
VLEAPERVQAQYFPPLQLDREVDIQPLLTPDRDVRGKRMFMEHVLTTMRGARERLYVQNQSLNLLDDNVDEFQEFFEVLRDQQRAGVDVRIITRDSREFGSGGAQDQQRILERIKDFGFLDCWETLYPDEPHPLTFRLHEKGKDRDPYCCDYFFATPELAPRLRAIRVDGDNLASDHQPVIVELR